MDLIIHDIEKDKFESLFQNIDKTSTVIFDNGNIKNCVGCFGCWIKTPGKCVIKDGYDNLGELFSKADRIIVISKCCFGGYSPFVKNVFDRSISYLLPFFKIINNETHHKARYNASFFYSVNFYGENISDKEKETAVNMIKAESVNFHSDYEITFSSSFEEACGKVGSI